MKNNFSRAERTLMTLAGQKQVRFAAARALNDCARAVATKIDADMPSIFDRPTRFTKGAVVAPRELAASKDKLAATVTVRPIQAQYLRLEETGGERSPADNTRKPASALTLPGKTLQLDAYGNIPPGTVKRFKAMLARAATKQINARHAERQAAGKRVRGVDARDRGVFYVPHQLARPNLPGGFWGRLPGHRIAHLISFAGEAHYVPKLHYLKSLETTVNQTWPKAMLKRLQEALETAR